MIEVNLHLESTDVLRGRCWGEFQYSECLRLAGGVLGGNGAVSNRVKLADSDLRVPGGAFFLALVHGNGSAEWA